AGTGIPRLGRGTPQCLISPECSALLYLGDKAQCYAVVAPALPRGRWTVVEHVPVVAAAAYTVVLRTRPDQFKISLGDEHVGNCGKETRPARSAIKFHCRGKERQTAASTDENPRPFLVIQGAGKRAFGTFPTQHIKLLGRQELLPLRFRVLEWLGGKHHIGAFCQILFPVLVQFFHVHRHSLLLRRAPRPRKCKDKGRDRQTFEQRAPLHDASVVASKGLPKCAIRTAQS